MTDFHATRMGQRFFEHTAPALAEQLKQLNANLERLTETLDRKDKTDGRDSRDPEEEDPPHARSDRG